MSKTGPCQARKFSPNKLLASRENLYATDQEFVLEKLEEQLSEVRLSDNAWKRGHLVSLARALKRLSVYRYPTHRTLAYFKKVPVN